MTGERFRKETAWLNRDWPKCSIAEMWAYHDIGRLRKARAETADRISEAWRKHFEVSKFQK